MKATEEIYPGVCNEWREGTCIHPQKLPQMGAQAYAASFRRWLGRLKLVLSR